MDVLAELYEEILKAVKSGKLWKPQNNQKPVKKQSKKRPIYLKGIRKTWNLWSLSKFLNTVNMIYIIAFNNKVLTTE